MVEALTQPAIVRVGHHGLEHREIECQDEPFLAAVRRRLACRVDDSRRQPGQRPLIAHPVDPRLRHVEYTILEAGLEFREALLDCAEAAARWLLEVHAGEAGVAERMVQDPALGVIARHPTARLEQPAILADLRVVLRQLRKAGVMCVAERRIAAHRIEVTDRRPYAV